ncbi:MAG: hypothetical protein ABJ242_02370 [Marinomonas sp.]
MLTVFAAALAQPMPPIADASAQIVAADAALFHAAFEACTPDTLDDLLTEDYRMLHDLGGSVADNRESFVTGLRQQCAARGPGGAHEGYKNRRLLVPGSRQITPLGQWGMLERGMHTFQELRQRPAGTHGKDDVGGPAWVQTGGARYFHVWQWMPEEGKFRLKESISVDHGAASRG